MIERPPIGTLDLPTLRITDLRATAYRSTEGDVTLAISTDAGRINAAVDLGNTQALVADILEQVAHVDPTAAVEIAEHWLDNIEEVAELVRLARGVAS